MNRERIELEQKCLSACQASIGADAVTLTKRNEGCVSGVVPAPREPKGQGCYGEIREEFSIAQACTEQGIRVGTFVECPQRWGGVGDHVGDADSAFRESRREAQGFLMSTFPDCGREMDFPSLRPASDFTPRMRALGQLARRFGREALLNQHFDQPFDRLAVFARLS